MYILIFWVIAKHWAFAIEAEFNNRETCVAVQYLLEIKLGNTTEREAKGVCVPK